jgi:hypothetical protein
MLFECPGLLEQSFNMGTQKAPVERQQPTAGEGDQRWAVGAATRTGVAHYRDVSRLVGGPAPPHTGAMAAPRGVPDDMLGCFAKNAKRLDFFHSSGSKF